MQAYVMLGSLMIQDLIIMTSFYLFFIFMQAYVILGSLI